MRFDVGVYATRISFEMRAILRRQGLYRRSRNDFQPQDSLLAVVLHKFRAENLRKLTRRRPPNPIHLK